MVAIEIAVIVAQLHSQDPTDNIHQADTSAVVHVDGTNQTQDAKTPIGNEEPMGQNGHLGQACFLAVRNLDTGHLVFSQMLAKG